MITKRPNLSGDVVRRDLEKPVPKIDLSWLHVILDEVYGATWDGDTTHGASRNALYDKIETLSAAAIPVVIDGGKPTSFKPMVGVTSGEIGAIDFDGGTP